MARRIVSSVSSIVTNQNPALREFSAGQKSKFNYLLSIFDEDEETAVKIIKNIDGRGQNSWPSINEKIRGIENANPVVKMYQNAINQAFELDQDYSPEDIIQKIGEIRRKLDLPAHTGRLQRHCLADFFSIFMVNDSVTQEAFESRSRKRSDVFAHRAIVRLKVD